MTWKRIHLAETVSTNTYARFGTTATNIIVTTDFQTCGRGQRGNAWESARGLNLLASVKVSPGNVLARDQFVLSMAWALAVKGALDGYAPEFTIKWPNDIYWRDKKISGTLIETGVTSRRISDCVFGVGVNINQQTFTGGAPNPVSLLQITGHETGPQTVLDGIITRFEALFELVSAGRYDAIRERYNNELYRRGEYKTYADETGVFEGKILEADRYGHLVMLRRDGVRRSYDLGEIKFII